MFELAFSVVVVVGDTDDSALVVNQFSGTFVANPIGTIEKDDGILKSQRLRLTVEHRDRLSKRESPDVILT